LLLVPHENSDSALRKLAEEVLALTKVNWNTTQFDQKLPAPIKAAREVGRILKHIEYGVPIGLQKIHLNPVGGTAIPPRTTCKA
jgi:hypothetical protein